VPDRRQVLRGILRQQTGQGQYRHRRRNAVAGIMRWL